MTAIVLWLSLAFLYAILLHCQWSIHIVQFEVQAAGIANRISLIVSSPQSRGIRLTIGACDAGTPIIGRGGCLRLGRSLGHAHSLPTHNGTAVRANQLRVLTQQRSSTLFAL